MKKNSDKIIIRVDLGKDFSSHVHSDMEKEFSISERKWGLSLDAEKKNTVFNNAVAQLEDKVSAVFDNPWEISNSLIMSVKAYKNIEISVPDERLQGSSLCLLRRRDGWEVDTENTIGATNINRIPEVVKKEIRSWAKTAIFYGVGSYGDDSGALHG